MLAAIMTVAMIPVTAFAAGGEASADGVEYATLEEALEKGGNVTLLRDVEVDTVTEIKNSTVLDLGGFTITNNVESERPFHVSAESFTVNASGGSMVIPAENTKALGFILVNSNCDFTINGGIYTGDTDNGAFFRFASGGTANVKISDITATTNADVFYSAETFDTINM